MKIDLMFATASDHAKLARVVERFLRADVPGWTWKATPRRLLAGLYVHYRNAMLRVRELQRMIQCQGDYARKLEAEIKRLQDYEKQVVYAGYRAEITTFHWSCGDGCCSDSWSGYRIINQFGVCEHEVGIDGENTYCHVHTCETRIREQFGSTIPISYDDDYSREG
jgi:hypothetical protein